MSSNSSVPGMIYPTQKAMLGSNPRESAMLEMENQNALQAQANKLMSGGKYKINKKYKSKRGGASTNELVVPQYQMLYTPQGGPGSSPNDQIALNAKISTQMAANSVYDQNATKMGGGKKHTSKRNRSKSKRRSTTKKYKSNKLKTVRHRRRLRK
jgi:hypothetical protein